MRGAAQNYLGKLEKAEVENPSGRPNNLLRQEGAAAPRPRIKIKKRQLNAWLREDQLSRFELMVIHHKRSTRKRGAMLVELMDLWDAHHGKTQGS